MSRLNSILPAAAGYLLPVMVLGALLVIYEPVAVSGGSMEPALLHGDLALVRRGADGVEGDVVLVRTPGRASMLHRVAHRHPDGSVTTRGDANSIADREHAPPEQVVGVVHGRVPVGILVALWRRILESATLSAQSDSVRR